jgi:hypothetical protein
MQVHMLSGPIGLGDDPSLLSNILSNTASAATPAIEQIIVPIIAPYAIALVLLSAAGLLFGITALSRVKRLEHGLKVAKSKSNAAKISAYDKAQQARTASAAQP